jgi:hypothetical protein
MRIEDWDARWHQLAEEVLTGMKEWRLQHPKATYREIETALDERLARVRARMLEDAALVSRAAEWEAESVDHPVCAQCGTPLQPRGNSRRSMIKSSDWNAAMECAPSVRRGFFPLDEELQLLAGHFTPSLYEGMTRLGTWMPFERAVKEVGYFLHVTVTEPTVRRTTQAAEAAYVAVQTAEVEQLERTLPPAPQGPAVQLLSVDGAYVPLVHKEWAEVKTLARGTVGNQCWMRSAASPSCTPRS